MYRSWIAAVLLVGCGGPAREFCDVRERCLEPTGVPELDVTGAADWCEARLEAATPGGAATALEACAACLAEKECDEISARACRATCDPLRQAIAQPGSVARTGELAETCTATSLETHASEQSLKWFGSLVIEIDCARPLLEDGIAHAVIIPDVAGAAGDKIPCGEMFVIDNRGETTGACAAAEGTLAVVITDGRRSYSGTCACGDVELALDVPYRLFGWGLTSDF